MPHASYDSIPDIGLLYDNVRAYAERGDARFYAEEAARSQGAILEIGCGTGRVLLPIARAGARVAGLDGSRPMLERFREKLQAEPETVRSRVTLHDGDARTFDLGATFALVTAPFRVIQHLATAGDQLQFLDAVHRHLAPGGRFCFDVFNPNFRALAAADGTEREDTPEQHLPDGRTFRRTARVTRVRWLDQVSEVELIYHVGDAPHAPKQRHVQAFAMRWYLRAELEHLLARGGFQVEAMYGNFDRSPLVDASPEMVVCAVRAP